LFMLCVTLGQALTVSGVPSRVRSARLLCMALLLLLAALTQSLARLELAALTAVALALLVVFEVSMNLEESPAGDARE
jgi:hypothetical protein